VSSIQTEKTKSNTVNDKVFWNISEGVVVAEWQARKFSAISRPDQDIF
jgi:hypothetical protein